MEVNYTYWFPPGTRAPGFVRINTSLDPNGWEYLRLNPSRKNRQWRQRTLRFWNVVRGASREPFAYAAVQNLAQDWLFSRRDFGHAELFALDTSGFLGQEMTPPVSRGCRLCGTGRLLAAAPRVDERTAIAWQTGFTSTGRFVVHVQVYEEMVTAGLTGFRPVPVDCLRPREYVIILWRGSLEKVKQDLQGFPGDLPPGIHMEEWGDNLVLTAPAALAEGADFDEIDAYLVDLHEREVLDYRLIPPAKRVGEVEARWVGIDVAGVAGTEGEVNDYDDDLRCPECGKGGLCPRGQLKVNCEAGDGSDIGLTEAGRICVSRKAFDILCKPVRLMAEPVDCV